MTAPPIDPVLPYGAQTNPGASSQFSNVSPVWTGVTENGNGPAIACHGVNGSITIEIVKTGSGTFTVDVEGTMDNASTADDDSPWLPVAFNVLGVAGLLTPVVTQNVGASDDVTWLSVLDPAETIRVNITDSSGSYSCDCRARMMPQ